MMNSYGDIVPLGEGKRRDFDVPALREDLAALWREESTVEGEENAVTRVCHTTLVVAAQSDDDVTELLEDIVRLNPSRVILIRPDASVSPRDARAWVSASCNRRTDGGGLVCSETIHVNVGEDTDELVASGIRSLAMGGVPLVVLADTVSPLKLNWVHLLKNEVDLVIGDSGNLDTDGGLDLWNRCDAPGSGVTYRDVLWTHLADWRRALAMWFDPPEEAKSLRHLSRITAEVAPGPGAVLKTWLLAGWLGARLGWVSPPHSYRGNRCAISREDGEVELAIRRIDLQDDPALTVSVRMEFDNGAPPVCWRRNSRQRTIEVERGDPPRPVARLNEAKTSRASAVVKVIHQPGPDPTAKSAMNFARHLGKAWEGRE